MKFQLNYAILFCMNPEKLSPSSETVKSDSQVENRPIEKTLENVQAETEAPLELPTNEELQEKLKENLQKKEEIIEKDETRLKEVRESLGLPSDDGEAPAIEAEKKNVEEMRGTLKAYKEGESTNYWRILEDLKRKNFSGGIEEKIKIADKALEQLKAESELVDKQIEAEKNRQNELRKSEKWDGSQKSELRSLNAKSDYLYGYELDIKRQKKELEKSLSDKQVESKEIQNPGSEKVKLEDGQEQSTTFKRLSETLGTLEQEIGRNGFNRISLHVDDLQRMLKGDKIDLRKANEMMRYLAGTFKKDFVPENRLQFEPQNFSRVIKGFEDTITVLYRFRQTLEEMTLESAEDKNTADELDRECNSVIGNIKKQVTYFEDLRKMLRRIKGE